MSPSTQKARTEFQDQLDWTMDDETLTLDVPRERPGPVVIRNRVVIDGKGCTIWAQAGPVLSVLSEKVILRNLRIEYTADGIDEGPNAGIALLAQGSNVTLEGVTVRGKVKGLVAEEGEWRYPHQLNLGALAHGMDHTLRIRVVVPVKCQLTSEISGLTIEPRTLAPGAHEIRLDIEQMMRDTLIFGTIGIKTAHLRREIVLNAHILTPAVGIPEPSRAQDRLFWQPKDWDTLSAGDARLAPAPPPQAPPPPPRVEPPVAAPPPKPKVVEPEPVAQALAEPLQAKPVIPVVSPPVVPLMAAPPERRFKKVAGSPLGSLFTSPPIANPAKPAEPASAPVANPVKPPEPPAPPAVVVPPPDVVAEAAAPSSKPIKPVGFKPKGTLFSPPAPKPDVVPEPPKPPVVPEVAATPPVPEVPAETPSTPIAPKKMKFKPIGGLPPWVPTPKPPDPPSPGESGS